MELSQNEKPPERGKKSFGDTGDQYMPIGALNQFSLDFRFKARILKKYPLKTYNNQKGTGVILNMDLIDREDT